MAIYIFEPAGAGGSQTLQQVLTTGSTLTVSNTITVNAGLYLEIDSPNFRTTGGFTFLGYNSGDIVILGTANVDGYLQTQMISGNVSISAKQYNGTSFIDNYFQIKPDSQRYYMGDYAQLNGLGYISVEVEDVYIKADYFEIRETVAGAGSLNLHGTAYVDNVTNPSSNAGHLVVNINGVTHYIALKT
jgi:hypothetical protein